MYVLKNIIVTFLKSGTFFFLSGQIFHPKNEPTGSFCLKDMLKLGFLWVTIGKCQTLFFLNNCSSVERAQKKIRTKWNVRIQRKEIEESGEEERGEKQKL